MATFTSTQSGRWELGATWGNPGNNVAGSGYPWTADNAQINDTHTITLGAGSIHAYVCASITFASGAMTLAATAATDTITVPSGIYISNNCMATLNAVQVLSVGFNDDNSSSSTIVFSNGALIDITSGAGDMHTYSGISGLGTLKVNPVGNYIIVEGGGLSAGVSVICYILQINSGGQVAGDVSITAASYVYMNGGNWGDSSHAIDFTNIASVQFYSGTFTPADNGVTNIDTKWSNISGGTFQAGSSHVYKFTNTGPGSTLTDSSSTLTLAGTWLLYQPMTISLSSNDTTVWSASFYPQNAGANFTLNGLVVNPSTAFIVGASSTTVSRWEW